MSRAASPSPSHPGPTTPRRVFLHLVACVSLALAVALSEVWDLGARQRRALRKVEIDLDLERLISHIRLLADWFRRARHTPRYRPREVRMILEYAQRYGLSAADIARDYLVSTATVYRWRKRRREAPPGETATEPTWPTPPCRRICDSRRQLVVGMAIGGFEGHRTIARHLLHQGEKISARSVGRFREEPAAKQAEKPALPLPRSPSELIEACAPHIPGPKSLHRPRTARLLRGLADAFTEGIASHNLRQLETQEDTALVEAERALLRSRRGEQLATLLLRFSRIPPRQRPHYTAAERTQILAFKYRFRLSNKALAAWFLLHPGTPSEWARDVDGQFSEKRIRALVEPLPDTAAAITTVAAELPPVPKRLRHAVEQTLIALAATVPARKRRARKDKTRPQPAPIPVPAAPTANKRDLIPIHARYANHYWTTDLTTIELKQTLHLGAIVDLYSRDILAWDLFTKQPTSTQVTGLFDQAVARHGPPKHFVSDRGGQFRGEAFSAALHAHGIDHRLGAVGQHGSIAIIERLWRTAKECLEVKNVRPNVPELLRERIAVVIDYYRTKRPHSSLGESTPAKRYRGETSPAEHAKPAPRGWRGQPSPPPPFVICHAFPDQRKLPYLERIA